MAADQQPDLAERRRRWDANQKERLGELERKWREQRIEIIREQLRDDCTETRQPNPDRKT